MLKTLRRRRLWLSVVSLGLVGTMLAGDAQAIDAGRDDRLIKHDGRGYNNPHAGFVAPPRGDGPLAPKAGSLIGTHSNDKHSGELTEKDQHILVTEREVGRRLDINNSYYGAFDSIASDWEPGDPEEFVQAWIRIYNIFKEVGADNVVWVWCGNASGFKHPNRDTGGYAWD